MLYINQCSLYISSNYSKIVSIFFSGERYDFVLSTTETVNNSWILVKGVQGPGNCGSVQDAPYQVAILNHNNSPLPPISSTPPVIPIGTVSFVNVFPF